MQLTCSFFRNKHTGELWSIKLQDGEPLAAVGPLTEAEAASGNPIAVDYLHRAIFAEGWDLADFEPIGSPWHAILPTSVCRGGGMPLRRQP